MITFIRGIYTLIIFAAVSFSTVTICAFATADKTKLLEELKELNKQNVLIRYEY